MALRGEIAWTRRITANILATLPASRITTRLDELCRRGDVIALQETGRGRDRLLVMAGRGKTLNSLMLFPRLGKRIRQEGEFTWARSRLGGGPIGVRNALGETLLGCRAKMLVGPGRMTPVPGRRTWLPPSWATITRWRRPDGRIVVRINIHLTASVQVGKHGYRTDKAHAPRVARHKAERRALEALVRHHLAKGHVVEVYGDPNYHQMPIPGLTAWWVISDAGTLGPRAIDGIWTSEGAPDGVSFLAPLVPGEHRHVITRKAAA